jgi:hypothetical protein
MQVFMRAIVFVFGGRNTIHNLSEIGMQWRLTPFGLIAFAHGGSKE